MYLIFSLVFLSVTERLGKMKKLSVLIAIILGTSMVQMKPSSASSRAIAAIHATWPASLAPRAIRIARCESGLNPRAVNSRNRNGTTDWGLFQLNDGGTMQSVLRGSWSNPVHNSRAAYRLYRQRGWGPWVCSRKV